MKYLPLLLLLSAPAFAESYPYVEWKWANLDDLPGMIVDFKKKLYEKLLQKIKLIIG